MALYEVTGRLWSGSQSKYIEVGEIVELDDELARVLLEKKAVKPAVFAPLPNGAGEHQNRQKRQNKRRR